MSLADMLATILGTIVLGAIVIAANLADRQRRVWLKRFVVATLIFFNVVILLAYGLTPILTVSSDSNTTYQEERVKLIGGLVNPSNMHEVTRLKESAAISALILTLVVTGLATAVLFRSVRQKIAFLFPREKRTIEPPVAIAPPPAFMPSSQEGESASPPLFPQMLNYYTQESMVLPSPTNAVPYYAPAAIPAAPTYQSRGFNPDSIVHMIALAFIIYLVGTQFIDYILGGGLEGVAQGLSGLTALDIVIGDLPLLLIPLLGVGIGIRRNWRQTLDRLGLRMPTGEGVGVAVVMTFGLLFFVGISSYAWEKVVSEKTLEEQTEASNALSSNVDTIFMAFVLAATAAIAEELAFRGAMQPIFGFWPTAIVFAMIHLQYTLTPASLLILAVAVAFGWIRQRYSTTISMMTHFLYNFIPLVLVAAASEQSVVWLMHLL